MVLCLLLIRMIRIMVKVARWSRMEEGGWRRMEKIRHLTICRIRHTINLPDWGEQMIIDVEFYELPDGTEPARVFLDGLEEKLRAKMFREIDLLVANGPELRAPHSKHIEDGIFELRA